MESQVPMVPVEQSTGDLECPRPPGPSNQQQYPQPCVQDDQDLPSYQSTLLMPHLYTAAGPDQDSPPTGNQVESGEQNRFSHGTEQQSMESMPAQPKISSAPTPSRHQKDTTYITLERPVHAGSTDTARYDRFVILAIVVSCLCFFLGGLTALLFTVPAILLALSAVEAKKSGNLTAAIFLTTISVMCDIIGIVVGVLTVVGVVLYAIQASRR